MNAWAIIALGLMLMGLAGEVVAAPWCRGIGDDASVPLQMAHIVGHPPRLLGATPSDCRPNENGCRSHYRPEPGSLVATFQSAEGLVCVEAATTQRRRWGWIPAANLRFDVKQSPVPRSWWLGQWWDGDRGDISISIKGRTMHANGDILIGAVDNPRIGGFDGDALESSGGLTVQQDYPNVCSIRIARFGSQLAVIDPCDPGFSMTGLYMRKSSLTCARRAVRRDAVDGIQVHPGINVGADNCF